MNRASAAFAVAAVLLCAARGARAADVGQPCRSDNECVVGSICGDAHVCVALPKKKSIIPFYFSLAGPSGYRHIPPLLYFHSWDKHRDLRLQVPLFAWRHDRDRNRTTTVVPLLFSSFSRAPDATKFRLWPIVFAAKFHPAGGQAAVLPLFWWQRRNEHTWFVAPLLLSGGQRDDINDITEAVIGLVGYYRRHGDFDTWRIVAPLFFDHKTRDTHTLVAPLTWWRHTPGHDAGVIFPILWQVHDEPTGYSHTLALPLFDWESERRGHQQRVVSLLFTWQRDDLIGLHQFLLYAPPIFHRSDRKRTVDVVPPLFTRWATRDDGSSGLIAGPLVAASDPRGSTTALVPIYWRFHDRLHDATTHILFPIGAWHHHTGARGGFLGPLYGWSSSNGAGGWGFGLAPLVMFGRRGARSHALVLPLFAHVTDARAGTSTTAIGPLYWRTTRDGADGGVFPLVFAGRHASGSYALVPPIFWHRSDARSTTDLIGPLYVTHGKRGWAFGLIPLLFAGNLDGHAHQVVFPLVWHFADAAHRRDRLLVGPYWHRRDGDETADALFPLFYLRRAPADGFGLWPLGGWRRKDGVSTTVVFPFVHQSNARTHARTTMIFPLLALHDSPRYSVRVLFPFFWRVHDGAETDTALFPLYFRARAPDHGWDGLFPLFVHAYTRTARTTVVGPFWYRARTDGGRGAGLFPLAAYGKKVGKDGKIVRWFGMPGVFADRNDYAGTSHVWAGPFFHFTQPDGYTSGLVPLVFAWRRGTASKVLSPLFYRQADAARDYALNVLGPFYVGHEGHGHQFGLFPLLMASTHGDGTWRAGVLPLFYGARRHDGSTLLTLLGGYSSYPGGRRVYVGPLYFRHDDKVHSGALFPIAYFGRNQVTGGRTDMVLPLYFDARGGDGRQLQAYTPLVWRYHNVESSTILGLPLFFDVHRYHESRLTGLLPLFMRSRSEVTRTTSWMIPPLLAWWRTPDDKRQGTDAVVFPLVWRFGGRDSSTVVFPLVWDFKRGESRTTVFAPFGAHWRRADGDHTLALNVYYRKGLGPRAGSWYLDVFPLFQVGRPRRHDIEWYFLEGLFGYSRQGRNRNLRLFWVLDFQLQPVPSSNLSWFGSTPPEARTLF